MITKGHSIDIDCIVIDFESCQKRPDDHDPMITKGHSIDIDCIVIDFEICPKRPDDHKGVFH